MISRSWPLAAAAVLSAAWFASAPVAQAQTPQGGTGQSGQQTPPAAAIPEQKLDAVATALERVTSVRQDFQERLNAAPGDDQQRIASEANTAMSKAVTDQGLSLDEFNAIIRMAQSDPDMREKILQRVARK
jgi:uncharacterized protein DUF4168